MEAGTETPTLGTESHLLGQLWLWSRLSPETWIAVAAVSLAVGVTVLRRPGDLFSASPWAEDIPVFFLQQAQHGYRPFVAYNGLMYLPQRTLAAIWSPLPARTIPLVYDISAIFLGVLSMAVVLGRRFALLVEPFSYRVLLFALLVLTPVASEVSGVLTNLHWWFGISLCLLALLGSPKTIGGKVLELFAVAVMSLAGLSALIALPCVVAGAILHRSRYVLVRASVIAIGAATQIVLLMSTERQHGSLAGLGHHISTVVEVATLRVGAARLLGEIPRDTALDRQEIKWTALLFGVGVLLLAVACLLRTKDRRVVVGLTASALLAVILGMLAVPTDTLTLLTKPIAGERYFFLPVALMAVVAVIGVSSPPRSWFAVILLVVCGVGALSGFKLIELRPVRDWPAFAECLEAPSAVIHACQTVVDPNWVVRVRVQDGRVREIDPVTLTP